MSRKFPSHNPLENWEFRDRYLRQNVSIFWFGAGHRPGLCWRSDISDQNAGGEHQGAAKNDLESGAQEWRFHIFVLDEGDCP
jgi:hypothetical protein